MRAKRSALSGPSRWWMARAETTRSKGPAGSGSVRSATTQPDGDPARRRPRLAEHGIVLVDPDGDRAGVQPEHGAQRLAGPGPEVEHPRHRQFGRGVGDGLLQALVGGDLGPHQVQVGGGVEPVLAHGDVPTRSDWRTESLAFSALRSS